VQLDYSAERSMRPEKIKNPRLWCSTVTMKLCTKMYDIRHILGIIAHSTDNEIYTESVKRWNVLLWLCVPSCAKLHSVNWTDKSHKINPITA